jgi:hypothetical protein
VMSSAGSNSGSPRSGRAAIGKMMAAEPLQSHWLAPHFRARARERSSEPRLEYDESRHGGRDRSLLAFVYSSNVPSRVLGSLKAGVARAEDTCRM